MSSNPSLLYPYLKKKVFPFLVCIFKLVVNTKAVEWNTLFGIIYFRKIALVEKGILKREVRESKKEKSYLPSWLQLSPTASDCELSVQTQLIAQSSACRELVTFSHLLSTLPLQCLLELFELWRVLRG